MTVDVHAPGGAGGRRPRRTRPSPRAALGRRGGTASSAPGRRNAVDAGETLRRARGRLAAASAPRPPPTGRAPGARSCQRSSCRVSRCRACRTAPSTKGRSRRGPRPSRTAHAGRAGRVHVDRHPGPAPASPAGAWFLSSAAAAEAARAGSTPAWRTPVCRRPARPCSLAAAGDERSSGYRTAPVTPIATITP